MDIRHILARKGNAVHTIGPRATVAEAVERMCETGISALVVSEDGATISGIISDRGIIRAIAGSGTDVMREKVSAVMTAEVITCTPADSIESVMQTMTERRIRHIPVADDHGLLIGLISIGDAVKNRLDELGDQTVALREYITGTY
jgi:CBS domain-containing protein